MRGCGIILASLDCFHGRPEFEPHRMSAEEYELQSSDAVN